ncbi:hypothetical protein D3C78_1673830 [compost metagenome]
MAHMNECSMSMNSSSQSMASSGWMARICGMTSAISSTSALARAMRWVGAARVSSVSGAGKRVSHQVAE